MPSSSPKGSPAPRERSKRKAREALTENDQNEEKDLQDENNENSNPGNDDNQKSNEKVPDPDFVCPEVPKRSKKWIDPSRKRSNIPKPDRFEAPIDLENYPSKDTDGEGLQRYTVLGKTVGTIIKKLDSEEDGKRKFVTWYICDMPGCTFRSKHGKGKLKQHLLNVHKLTDEEKITWFTCPYADKGCTFKSKQRGHLKRHLIQVHNRAEGGEMFTGEDGLEKSVLTFFQCVVPNCAFQTMRMGNLKRHYIKIHGFTEESTPKEIKTKKQELALKEDPKPAPKAKVTRPRVAKQEKVKVTGTTEKSAKKKKKSTIVSITTTEDDSEEGEVKSNTEEIISENVPEAVEEEEDVEMTML